MPRGRATPITTTWYSRDRRMGMPPPVISKDGFSSRAKGEQRTQTVIQLWLNVPYLSVGILARRSASPWPSLSRSVCSRISRHRCWELVHKAENARARSCAPPHRTSHSGPPAQPVLHRLPRNVDPQAQRKSSLVSPAHRFHSPRARPRAVCSPVRERAQESLRLADVQTTAPRYPPQAVGT